MSFRYVSLKALQRSHSPRSETPEKLWRGGLLKDKDGLLSRARPIRTDPERTAQVLGATTKTNQYGAYLSVRCWCAQSPQYSPDLRSAKLLLAEGPHQTAEPAR